MGPLERLHNNRRVPYTVSHPSPWLFGILFTQTWIHAIQRTPLAGRLDPSASGITYLATTLACITFLVFSVVRNRDIQTKSTLSGLLLFLSVIGTLLLCYPIAGTQENTLGLIGAVLCGVGVGWTYMLWGTWYKTLDIKDAFYCIFISMALGSVTKALFTIAPAHVIGPAMAALPMLSYVFLLKAKQLDIPSVQGSHFFTTDRLEELVRQSSGVAAFGLILGLIQAIKVTEFLHPAIHVNVIWHIFEALVALSIIAWVILLRKEPTVAELWRATLFMLASGLVGFSVLPDAVDAYSMSFIATAQTTLVMVLWVTLSDIAHRTRIDSVRIYAGGWIAYTALIPLGSFISNHLLLGTSENTIILVCIYLTLIVMVFLINDKSATQAEILSGLSDKVDRGNENALKAKAVELASRHDLTPRETEILELLAMGRTRTYIASQLYISENTVKGHIKNIYSKLGIHSKQELLDVIGLN